MNHNEKIKKEQKILRKVGWTLLVLGLVFFPIACMLHYHFLGISGILITVGALVTLRSYIHSKYQNTDE